MLKLGELQEAEQQLRQVVQDDPANLTARIALAQSLAKLGRPDDAKQRLRELLRDHPDQSDVLLELGNLELGTGQVPQAFEHLQQAAKLKPESREVIYAYAKALQASGKTAEAAPQFKFVDEATKPLMQLKKLLDRLVQEPNNLDVRFQIAAITWKYKSREEGVKWFLSLLRLAPRHAPTHAALVIHYHAVGDQERAAVHRGLSQGLEDVKKITKVEPAQEDPHAAGQPEVEKAAAKP